MVAARVMLGIGAACLTAADAADAAGAATTATAAAPAPLTTPATKACAIWAAWEGFARNFVTDSGRVIDPATAGGLTTSEGQAYALFFALVANDRARFEQVLRWSEDNLAGGDLTARLPAWSWGKRADGSYGIQDDNPASDADLWFAYALEEAGRLWQAPKYTALGKVLAERILREETVVLDGLGRTLLPAPKGFQPTPGSARLNPSYAPPQLLRRLAAGSDNPESAARWSQQVRSTARMFTESAPRGFVPDWIGYTVGSGFGVDRDSGATGSFNAIRTYLWVGTLAHDEPLRAQLQRALRPMVDFTLANGAPPQRVDTRSGVASGSGDAGFSAALMPLMAATAGSKAISLQRDRITARDPMARRDNYYEQALTLFGLGWIDGHYQFSRDGMLRLRWTCSAR